MASEVKIVPDNKKPKDELQSGTEAGENKEQKPKKKRSKEFEENIIRDTKTAKKKGKKGGKKSGETRRVNRDARQAARLVLDMATSGQVTENLNTMKIKEADQTGIVAIMARLYTMSLAGNLDAYRELMKMAGYEPEENRKERESVNSERRRDIESEAKVNALGGNLDNAKLALNMSDEDDNTDVVIYLPEKQKEEECELPPEDEENDSGTDEEGNAEENAPSEE